MAMQLQQLDREVIQLLIDDVGTGAAALGYRQRPQEPRQERGNS